MKKINELTYEDYKALIENNNDLKNALIDRWIEHAEWDISEYLYDCKGVDYCIDNYGYSYFRITDWQKFSWWYEDVKKMYCFLTDEDDEIIQKYLHYAEIYENLLYIDCKEKDFNKVEELTEKYQEQAGNLICKSLLRQYAYEDDWLLEEFDFWLESKCIDDEDNIYMTDDYKIFEHVPEYVVKAHEAQII